LSLIQTGGHWIPRTVIQFYKTTDPLVLFAGVGVEYGIPKSFGGIKVEPGLRYTYNVGFGFALSERSTLGFSLNGSLSDRKKVGGVFVPNSVAETMSARLTLIQRLADNFWIEPSVTVGLTDDTPDVSVGLTLRKRF
jgi:hypothetical protein